MTRPVLILLVTIGACVRGGQGELGEPSGHATDDAPTSAAPPAQPQSEPDPTAFEPATRGSGACVVTVSALLEAKEFRGPGPITPAVADSLAADPQYARSYQSMSHGDHHLQCVYEIELGSVPGKRYRWREVHSNTLRERTPADCNGLAAEVAEHVITSTKQCTDLDAGAYWGYVLEAML